MEARGIGRGVRTSNLLAHCAITDRASVYSLENTVRRERAPRYRTFWFHFALLIGLARTTYPDVHFSSLPDKYDFPLVYRIWRPSFCKRQVGIPQENLLPLTRHSTLLRPPLRSSAIVQPIYRAFSFDSHPRDQHRSRVRVHAPPQENKNAGKPKAFASLHPLRIISIAIPPGLRPFTLDRPRRGPPCIVWFHSLMVHPSYLPRVSRPSPSSR